MSGNSSEALLTVIAVVIFGIFVMLAKEIFGKQLKTMLTDLFTKATEEANTNAGWGK